MKNPNENQTENNALITDAINKRNDVKIGRESLPEESKRLSVVKLYLTRNEKAWLQQHRKNSNYKQDSRFAFEMIKNFSQWGHFSYEIPVEINKRLQNAILGLANNCNQMMAHTHSTSSSKHMEEFRFELRKALAVMGRVNKEIKEHKEAHQINFPSVFDESDQFIAFDQVA
tara:strand:+ start:3591 stop:4106 length:516 start_codon:yes stop_codon:yes gene_type:complete